MFTILIPCYNEESNIMKILEAIDDLRLKSDFKILFVDDGSTDNTWKEINACIETFSKLNVEGVKLSRNFGKDAAIEAGMNNYSGDFIVTIDCDLQHPVELIPKMIDLWEENNNIHIINAIKNKRQEESKFKRFAVRNYYKIFNISTGINLSNHSDFKLIDALVINEYLNLTEKNKFYRGLTEWLGFNSIDIKFTPLKRAGNSESWSIKNLFSYAKSSILSFSNIPLKLITWLGLISIFFSFILALDTIIKKFFGETAEGFPTVILLQLFMGSLILICLGIIGEYLSEIYKELKNRPSYVISEKVSVNENKKT